MKWWGDEETNGSKLSLYVCFEIGRIYLLICVSQRDTKEVEGLSAAELIKVDPATGLKVLPHWLAQPYFRPQPTAETNTTILTQGDGVAVAGMILGILLLTLYSCSILGELLVAKRLHSNQTPKLDASTDGGKRARVQSVPTLTSLPA